MDVIYYPYHTPRGTYHPYTGGAPVLDANGGSWLGKQVIQQIDGTFLFDNLWHDTVVIRANAVVGDHWIFYNDTALRYYRADVTGADTATVLGTLDSVKTINITAYDDTGLVPADPYNNFKIELSKNHGFVQVFDLYTFPYHFYGKDYFMDRVLTGTGFPTPANSSFTLTSLINPTFAQLYDWNAGDVFENSTGLPGPIVAECTPSVIMWTRSSIEQCCRTVCDLAFWAGPRSKYCRSALRPLPTTIIHMRSALIPAHLCCPTIF